MNMYFYETDIGRIALAGNAGAITNLYFETDAVPAAALHAETPEMQEAARQLYRYLAGDVRRFSLPLAPSGTAFMRGVWQALEAIPYGQTASYSDIALAVGNPRAARAVGLANNRNPLPIFIPCHRVVGRDARLVGYRGGLALKKRLLELEQGHGTLLLRTG